MGDEQPARECDLVMKGGIASGIVYPPAVLKLHEEKYRFRCIGGASAGAIAAAGAAAAQYGEDAAAGAKASAQPGASKTGFDRLRELNDELGREGFILDLFQPTEDARPFFEIALRAQKGASARPAAAAGAPRAREKSLPWMILTRLPRINRTLRSASEPLYAAGRAAGGRWGARVGVALGSVGLLGSLVCSLLSAPSHDRMSLVFGCLPGLVAALVAFFGCYLVGRSLGGSVEVVLGLVSGDLLGHSLFGACTGHSRDPARPALTDWLHTNLNGIAGKPLDQPLTFGDLEGSTPGKKEIELRMITTDLSYGQPYKLPFDTREFLFQAEEMRELFPEEVVAYLIEHSPPDTGNKLPDGYHRLPVGRLMPVVVATRMSLSFPLLLSAVPLYRLSNAAERKHQRDPEHGRAAPADLERHCFSDGGISSNFPIHFFDRWLPQRPTFGILLATTEDPAAEPTLPDPREYEKARPAWKKIANLGDFLWSIVDTAMSYRDNMQSILPSYRERIVQVPLLAGQGGLNLDMGPEVVEAIKQKGSDAGALLAEDFDFAQHQWVRLSVLAAHLEQELGPLRQTFLRAPGGTSIIDAQLAAFTRAVAEKDETLKWYRPRNKAWCEQATQRMNELMSLAASWEDARPDAPATASAGEAPVNTGEPKAFFSRDPPVPDSALRITPEL